MTVGFFWVRQVEAAGGYCMRWVYFLTAPKTMSGREWNQNQKTVIFNYLLELLGMFNFHASMSYVRICTRKLKMHSTYVFCATQKKNSPRKISGNSLQISYERREHNSPVIACKW